MEEKLRDQQIGGSFGFTLIKLDDGRFVVRLVTDGSPAALTGITFGAEIVEVNDKPITEAINLVSVLWAEQIPATKETKQLLQSRLIGRAPVDKMLMPPPLRVFSIPTQLTMNIRVFIIHLPPHFKFRKIYLIT